MTIHADKQNSGLRSLCVSGKKRYRTQERAEQALRSALDRAADGDPKRRERRVYECNLGCGGWHLSSKELLTERKTAIKPRSDKRAKLYRTERVPLVAEQLAAEPFCQIRWDENCAGIADTVHELKKRSRGGSIVQRSNCVSACSYCNGAVEDHPEEAHERGFALHSWEDSA